MSRSLMVAAGQLGPIARGEPRPSVIERLIVERQAGGPPLPVQSGDRGA